MSNCKRCKADIKIVEGRRPRQFCNPNCRNMFYYYEKKKSKPPAKRGRPPMTIHDDRSNPLINAARGRDESGINEDEIRSKISEMEKEMQSLGQSVLAKRRAAFLQGQIIKLKQYIN